jgi:hypothetical protein
MGSCRRLYKFEHAKHLKSQNIVWKHFTVRKLDNILYLSVEVVICHTTTNFKFDQSVFAIHDSPPYFWDQWGWPTELYLYIWRSCSRWKCQKVCDQKHGGFYVTIDLFSWGFPLTRGSNVRGRQSSTPPGFYSDLGTE